MGVSRAIGAGGVGAFSEEIQGMLEVDDDVVAHDAAVYAPWSGESDSRADQARAVAQGLGSLRRLAIGDLGGFAVTGAKARLAQAQEEVAAPRRRVGVAVEGAERILVVLHRLGVRQAGAGLIAGAGGKGGRFAGLPQRSGFEHKLQDQISAVALSSYGQAYTPPPARSIPRSTWRCATRNATARAGATCSRIRSGNEKPGWPGPSAVDRRRPGGQIAGAKEAPMPHAMLTTDPLHAAPRVWGDPGEVASGVFMYPAFVNSYALQTPAGLLLVDPGFGHASASLREAVRGWSDAPLHTAVYTHGHVDHAFGLRAFLDAGDTPQIVAQENCLGRFRRYALTNGWNARINQRQFSLPQPYFPHRFDWPTLTFRERLTQRLGDLEVQFHAAKGETDDACWAWVPAHRYLFAGDLIIWQAPNCGNPQKVQRYPAEWADALETMAGLDAEYLFPGHGLAVQGRVAVRTVLTETARYLRIIVDQVLERMNAGQTPEEIFHGVEPDPELATRPYLAPNYDHPKFIVRNLLRLWGGWWNGNAADLLPATWEAQAQEIAALAGGVATVIARGRALLAEGKTTLAQHLAEWATLAAPADRAAQELKRDVYSRRLAEESSLMAQGIYRAAMNDARAALKEEPEQARGLGMGWKE